MRPVVIVHGSWHQPAHYQVLADELRSGGVDVTVPDVGMLPLAERTAVVQALVDAQKEPPVVVAHSSGGIPGGSVTGATHILFLSAWVLDVGETPAGWLQDDTADPARGDLEKATTIGADGRSSEIDPTRAIELFYADCPPAVADHAVDLLRPDLSGRLTASPEHAAWRDTPTTYLLATEDRTWPTGLDRVFAARCTTQDSLPTSHSPFLSRPTEVARRVRTILEGATDRRYR